MSIIFTPPANQSWQTLLAGDSPFLAELTLAYSERRQVINQSAYTPSAGKDVQAAAYWTILQNWLETYCVSFIDHVNGPLNPAADNFLYFTLATWRAAAGLNASGFRRSPLSGGTEYGQMQAADAINGPIFEDLQKGFGALKMLSYANRIFNVRATFPSLITAGLEYTGNITQVGSQYNGSTLLGVPAHYSIVWNGQSAYAQPGREYVSIGKGGGGPVESAEHCVRVVNDSKSYTDPATEISYTVNASFDDEYVKVWLCNTQTVNVIAHSNSFTDTTISTSGTLPAENAPSGQSFLAFDFYVTLEPPFTNA